MSDPRLSQIIEALEKAHHAMQADDAADQIESAQALST